MPRRRKLLASSLEASSSSIGIRRSSSSTIVTWEPKREKIEANSQPITPPPRMTRRGGTSVCASNPVESTQRGESSPGIGGRIGCEPVATIALLNSIILAARDLDRIGAGETAGALDPLDAVGLEESRHAVGQALDSARLPGVGALEIEARLVDADAEVLEALLDLLDRARRLHPGLGGNAADAQADSAERGLLLDADDPGAELRGANRGRVTARAASEYGDVTLHDPSFPPLADYFDPSEPNQRSRHALLKGCDSVVTKAFNSRDE